MILLNKILPLFFLPLGVALLLLIAGLVRRSRQLLWSGVAVLLISSNPFVGRYLIRSAEGWAERKPVAETATADAVVVLSAGRSVAPGKEGVSEWSDANRFFGGVELFLAGKAPLLVFTGALLPWEKSHASEGDLLAAEARKLGVPADALAVTGTVLNTADESREVSRLLRERHPGRPRVLLVTSAFHMARARQLFEQEQVVVDPFPVSFAASGGGLTLLDFLPSNGALGQTQTALREGYGRAYYWLRQQWFH